MKVCVEVTPRARRENLIHSLRLMKGKILSQSHAQVVANMPDHVYRPLIGFLRKWYPGSRLK